MYFILLSALKGRSDLSSKNMSKQYKKNIQMSIAEGEFEWSGMQKL